MSITTPTPEALRLGAIEVAEQLLKSGYEAWFAGGCVRDQLLGRTPKDWDLATDATPAEVDALFKKTLEVGAAFGVVQVLWTEHRAYEVATFRAEGEYEDGRRPSEVRYSKSRREDVERRDFTINALLMHPTTEEILDYVGGRQDLEAGIIRAVGEALERFREDRLRMLRAVRFAARFGFTIEEKTWNALVSEAHHLPVVSPERVTLELEGILYGPSPGLGFRLLESSGLAPWCLPATRSADLVEQLDRLGRCAHEDDSVKRRDRIYMGWALVCGVVSEDELESQLRSRKLPRHVMRAVQELLRLRDVMNEEAHSTSPHAAVLRWVVSSKWRIYRAYLACAFGENSAEVVRFSQGRAFVEKCPPVQEAILTGRDLQDLGFQPGPHFKRLLTQLEDEVLEGHLTTREAAVARAQELAEDDEAR